MTDTTGSSGLNDGALDASEITQGGTAGLSGKASDLKARAQQALSQGSDQVRLQAMQAKDYANQQFGQYQQQLTDRIVEKPLTSALVALGAGVVLGLALTSGRGDRD
ncbi:MAG: hypothetical protein KY446_01215 [Proteobacteria bacterium]|nr:hypothetical protein [Pseudomonadota bacterium]